MAVDELIVADYARLYLGRGLQGEPLADSDQLELSVDLYDLGEQYAADWLEWAGVDTSGGGGGGPSPTDTAGWMPLTTVAAGVPELVWDGDDNLIPTYGPF